VAPKSGLPVKEQDGMVKDEGPNVVGRGSGVSYHQRHEEYNESRFDNTPLADTPRKSVREIHQNGERCLSCFKTR
jgi:hypothetical protein